LGAVLVTIIPLISSKEKADPYSHKESTSFYQSMQFFIHFYYSVGSRLLLD